MCGFLLFCRGGIWMVVLDDGGGGGGYGADFSGDSEALLGRAGFAQGVGLEPGEVGDA